MKKAPSYPKKDKKDSSKGGVYKHKVKKKSPKESPGTDFLR